jgi:hypothetical protein
VEADYGSKQENAGRKLERSLNACSTRTIARDRAIAEGSSGWRKKQGVQVS